MIFWPVFTIVYLLGAAVLYANLECEITAATIRHFAIGLTAIGLAYILQVNIFPIVG